MVPFIAFIMHTSDPIKTKNQKRISDQHKFTSSIGHTFNILNKQFPLATDS